MPGQRGTETRQMARSITVRMSEELCRRAEEVADGLHVTVAAWLRELVANAAGRVELVGPRSAPRARARKKPDRCVRELVGAADRLSDLHTVLVEFLETPTSLGAKARPGDHDHREKIRWAIAVVREVSDVVVSATLELRSP